MASKGLEGEETTAWAEGEERRAARSEGEASTLVVWVSAIRA